MGKPFRSSRIRWAASWRLCAAAACVLPGAAGAQAQSIDIFGAAPPPAPTATATATAAAAPRIAVAKGVFTWTPRPGPPPRAAIPQAPHRENAPAQTPHRRFAQATTHAAPPAVAAVHSAAATTPPPAAPVASSPPPIRPAPAPIIAPRPAAKPSTPKRSQVQELLYPLGTGLVLALELAVLWLILRWRARRAKRAKRRPPPAPRPAAQTPAQTSAPAPAVAESDEDHAAIIARLFDEAHEVEHDPERAPASAFIATYTAGPDDEGPDDAEPFVAKAPAIELTRRPDPGLAHPDFIHEARAPEPIMAAPQREAEPAEPTRGVFKPSPLFNRPAAAEPVRTMPIALPDPLRIGFEALRLSVSAARIELRFRVTLRNDGPAPLGPIRVDSCMSTAEGDLPDTALAHSLTMLMPGEEAAIAEEWRVPLARLPALRLGTMRWLVGAARIFATIEGTAAHPFQDRTFMIGLPEEGGRLAPIPLDGGAHLYDNLLVQSVAPERG